MSTRPGRKVFVTGMGVVSPLGNEVHQAFERLFQGDSAIRKVRVGSEESGTEEIIARSHYEWDERVPRVRWRLMAQVSQMAVLAAMDAVEAAGLPDDGSWQEEIGVYMGSGLGGTDAIESHMRSFLAKPRGRARPATVPMIMVNGPASHIAMQYGIRGPSVSYSVACASSAMAVGEAFRAIRDGYLDRAIVGGTEAQLQGGTLAAWKALGALATEHPEGPEHSCRPFDAERTGLVLGEGAAVLVLESEAAAAARGAEPLAQVLGYGVSTDAHNLTEPLAEGQVIALRRALSDADVAPEAVGYVNAHGTGTVSGDRAEWEALGSVLGERAAQLRVSSSKAAHGHLVGGAGAMESVWTVMALRSGRIPPTASLGTPDPDCPLDCVPLTGREDPGLTHALSNSFAFGGTNAVLVFAKV